MNAPRGRCCLFDAAGTLIYPEPNALVVYHQFGQRFGDRRPLSLIGQIFQRQVRESFGPQVLGRTNGAVEVDRWKSVVQGVFGHLSNWPLLFDELWNYFAMASNWRLYADADATIRAMQEQGIAVGIASNFDARLHSICQGLPALRELKSVFISAELGWRKPSQEFFLAIMERMGDPDCQLWMVGDDLDFDVRPAQAFGWQSIYLNRQQSAPIHRMPDQTICIRSLTQLPSLLLS